MKKEYNNPRISLIEIIRDHVSTIRDVRKNWCIIDYILFRVFAPLLAFLFLWLSFYKNDFDVALPLIQFSTVDSLLTSFSIFVVLLLNLLVLTYSISAKFKYDDNINICKSDTDFITHMHNNITFGIIVALTGVIWLLIYNLQLLSFSWILEAILVYLIYLMLIYFVLIMLVILEAVHIVFTSIFR